ncbi:hypothetical protein Patl1_02776 [Pistacia atlantica]|uniref:Uncharacterized protein n=1 Tax=Pistacia atlantica TaxID=434234 RepID=A0ACC1CDG6_9ROSI|nr:hypothetical protein Patl1_02776 [Pistacia atlantica]
MSNSLRSNTNLSHPTPITLPFSPKNPNNITTTESLSQILPIKFPGPRNQPHSSPAQLTCKPPPPNTLFSNYKPLCQICGKTNHQALDCYHRMDFSYQGRHPPAQLAAMAAHTHVQQEDAPSWFLDSGANSHVTSALENLTIQQQPYQGPAQVTVGNGGGHADPQGALPRSE